MGCSETPRKIMAHWGFWKSPVSINPQTRYVFFQISKKIPRNVFDEKVVSRKGSTQWENLDEQAIYQLTPVTWQESSHNFFANLGFLDFPLGFLY